MNVYVAKKEDEMASQEDIREVERLTPQISSYIFSLNAKYHNILGAIAIIIGKTIDDHEPEITIDRFCKVLKSYYENKEYLQFQQHLDQIDKIISQDPL